MFLPVLGRELKPTAVGDGWLQPGEEAEYQILNLECKNEGFFRPEKGPSDAEQRGEHRVYRQSLLAKERR